MKTKIVILAAGKGSRMKNIIPKVLIPVNGKPMIQWLIESVKKSNIDNRPIVVVSLDNREQIKENLKNYNLTFVNQEVQLGSGHALACAMHAIEDDIDSILVLYGDHPFIKADTIKRIATSYIPPISMLTTEVIDFDQWRINLYYWGRIIRDEKGKMKAIVEFNDADDNIKNIKEVNPAIYCFSKKWLEEHINQINNDNNEHEYYLTDLIRIAFVDGSNINSIHVDPKEAIGIDTKEELEVAQKLFSV